MWQSQSHSAQRIANKIRNMQMTVFQAKLLPEETFGLSSPLALCS